MSLSCRFIRLVRLSHNAVSLSLAFNVNCIHSGLDVTLICQVLKNLLSTVYCVIDRSLVLTLILCMIAIHLCNLSYLQRSHTTHLLSFCKFYEQTQHNSFGHVLSASKCKYSNFDPGLAWLLSGWVVTLHRQKAVPGQGKQADSQSVRRHSSGASLIGGESDQWAVFWHFSL